MTDISKLPDDMIFLIKSYVIFKPKTKQELIDAIKLYNKDIDKCKSSYGDISLWNTSLISNMSDLFKNTNFNGDISNWNTSNVTDMSYMFNDAKNFSKNFSNNFSQNISNWPNHN